MSPWCVCMRATEGTGQADGSIWTWSAAESLYDSGSPSASPPHFPACGSGVPSTPSRLGSAQHAHPVWCTRQPGQSARQRSLSRLRSPGRWGRCCCHSFRRGTLKFRRFTDLLKAERLERTRDPREGSLTPEGLAWHPCSCPAQPGLPPTSSSEPDAEKMPQEWQQSAVRARRARM